MAEHFQNNGPVTKAKYIGKVTTNSYIATTTIHTNGLVPHTVQSKTFSFKNIPEPHPSFTGKDEYIKSAIEYLNPPEVAHVQIPCMVIHALGGYGKTQTVRKIVSVCKEEHKFQHFIWIDSQDDLSIKKCFIEIMKQVGLAGSEGTGATNFDSLIHQFYVLLASRTEEKCLIIFDDVGDFDNVMKFLPSNDLASNFAVLMTSPRPFTQKSYGHVRNQPLDLMLEEEAIQLVENILGILTIDSEEDKKLLVKQSGRIALVLHGMTSAIRYIRKYQSDHSIKDYLREMRYRPIQYSDQFNELDLTYKKSLQNIVGFAIKKLNTSPGRPRERVAVMIFDRLAYCSSSNWVEEAFVQRYFWDICEKAKKMDMELPAKLDGDMQIFRLAIEILSESSLVQVCSDELTVHPWVQASRRLDLKRSGDERTILKNLLSIVPDMSKKDENNSIIWEHVVDYPDLVHEFYAKKGTLMKFPILDVDLLEKIIRTLTQSADFQPSENYSKEIEEIICNQIRYSSVEAVKRTVNLFNYGVRKKSRKFISAAISATNLDVFNWLVNENSCIPEEEHFRRCIHIFEIDFLAKYLQQLKEFYIEIPERNLEGSSSNITTRRIASLGGCILSVLTESDPLRMRLCKSIEKRILHCEPRNVEVVCDRWPSDFLNFSEISGNILRALKTTEPDIDLDEISAKYSENHCFECLFICGRTHCHIKEDKYEISLEEMKELNWNSLHRAAYKNDFTAIKSIDVTFLESKDNYERTPLMVAVEAGSFDATAVLLKKYSANANAMDMFENTPLQTAIWLCYPSICKLLLSHGAKAHWRTESGTSVHALHEAVRFFQDYDGPESEDIIVTLLTSKDCDVCVTDGGGDNILHLLVRYYYATRYKPNHRVLHLILLMNATLVNVQNNDGHTPLQLAANLRAAFSKNHWHAGTLQSFTSEVGKLCNWDRDD